MDALDKLKESQTDEKKSAAGQKILSFMDMYRAWEAKKMGLKSLYEETDAAGGALTPDQFLSEAIEVARSGAVVLPLCTSYNMTTDKLKVPRISTGSSVYWEQTGGFANKTQTDQIFDYVELDAKTIYGLTALSEQLAEDSNPDAVKTVQNDLAKAMVVAMDKAILEGAGSGADPITGIAGQANVTTLAAGAAFTADDISAAIAAVESNIFNANGVVTHPSVIQKLRDLKDSNGQYLWADPRGEAGQRTVFGIPVKTQGSLTATAGQRKVFVGQWDEALVGARRGITLAVSKDALFTYDQIAVRLTARLGFGVKHGQAFAVITGV